MSLLQFARALKVLGFRPSRRMLGEMSQEVDVHDTAKGTVSFEGFLEIVVRLQGTSDDSHGEIMQVLPSLAEVMTWLYIGRPHFCQPLGLPLHGL